MSLNSEAKAQVVEKFQRSEGDTGSVEVQVALLTTRIVGLTEHMKANKKDFHSRRGLVKMVSRRRSLLKYLKSVDQGRYKALIQSLGLRN